MIQITISEELKQICPKTALGVICYKAVVEKSSNQLLEKLNETISEIAEKYEISDIAKLPHIKSTREAYKKLGKSPQEYRNAAEAMIRRIVKGNGLYNINNAVEINNMISISSGYSIGSYDISALIGDIVLQRAEQGEKYQGIGKSSLNIEFLPTLYDEEGAFGNPTSDSQRAMIKEGVHEIMMCIYSFDGKQELQSWLDTAQTMIQLYCHGEIHSCQIIE